MKYNILKAQSGTKIPLSPRYKNYPKPRYQGKIKKDETSQLERSIDNLYRDKIKSTPIEGIIKTIIPSAAIASGAAAGPILTTAKGVATAAGYGALQGLGFSQLGLGSGNAVDDAFYGASGEFIGPIAGKVINNGSKLINKGINLVKNSIKPKGYKTTIDWGKWNPEILENKSLLKEYYDIEKNTIANGT